MTTARLHLSQRKWTTRQSSTVQFDMFDNISTDQISAVIAVQFKVQLPTTVLEHHVQYHTTSTGKHATVTAGGTMTQKLQGHFTTTSAVAEKSTIDDKGDF